MSTFSDPKSWPTTLADHDGVWCALCLRQHLATIALDTKAESFHQHHVIDKSVLKRILQKLKPFAHPVAWTIPVHPDCHIHITRFGHATTALDRLHDDLTKPPKTKPARATRMHIGGFYSRAAILLSSFLIDYRSERIELTPSQYASYLYRLTNSQAGVAAAGPSIEIGEALKNAEQPDQILIKLSYANLYANKIDIENSKRLMNEIDHDKKMLRNGSDSAFRWGSYLTRMTQISSNEATAIEAKEFAIKENLSKYTLHTVVGLHAWRMLNSDPPSALEGFNSLLSHANELPWLYIAEALFGKACWGILDGSPPKELIYVWLIQAEFIYVLLGLQPWPHIGLPNKFKLPTNRSSYPGHILVSSYFREFAPNKRETLRCNAIGRLEPKLLETTETDSLYLSITGSLVGRERNLERIMRFQLKDKIL